MKLLDRPYLFDCIRMEMAQKVNVNNYGNLNYFEMRRDIILSSDAAAVGPRGGLQIMAWREMT